MDEMSMNHLHNNGKLYASPQRRKSRINHEQVCIDTQIEGFSEEVQQDIANLIAVAGKCNCVHLINNLNLDTLVNDYREAEVNLSKY